MNEFQETATQPNITFVDIAAGDGAGISYRRTPSRQNDLVQALQQLPVYNVDEPAFPMKPSGAPGVAVLDYDGDGDQDIYVTNGPGTANSLYSNQLEETGQLTFVDVAEAAGATLTDQDSSGISYGDTDNDGDLDLFVVSAGDPNRFLENQGDGTFVDITAQSGLGEDSLLSIASSLGDVNGDGLLDIVVGNSFSDWNDSEPVTIGGLFDRHEPNQLFLNQGDNVFVEVSEASGFRDVDLPEELLGEATLTMAIAMVDYDLDGDMDIVQADLQTPVATPPHGFVRIFQNDGSGQFEDVTLDVNMDVAGSWMGLSFGDLNSDGNMDIFSTNLGDYIFGNEFTLGLRPSRWFLGQDDGTFTTPDLGELVTTPFGWGTSFLDYDNDADSDIIFHGGSDLGIAIDGSNPGVLLQNDGAANFSYDAAALATSTNHTLRLVQGSAVGDLDNDGFVDMVSVSSLDAPESLPTIPYINYGGPFDNIAVSIPLAVPIEPDNFLDYAWTVDRDNLLQGTLSVEINSASNGNNWVAFETLGTVGLTEAGRTNRDGIGAVVMFTPEGGATAMNPISGGASYASQDSLTANFGLGTSETGMVEVLWAGGVRNRLYDVQAGETLVMPEIPVSYDGEFASVNDYQMQVDAALDDLVAAEVLTQAESDRLFASSVQAYMEENDLANDLAMGSAADDELVGRNSDDHLHGLGGDDVVAGGMGDDTLFGGDGADVLRGDRHNRQPGGTVGGNDIIYGGDGDDSIGGKAGDDTLYGENGDDRLWGDHGDDLLRGGLGDDTLTGDNASGGSGRDTFVLALGEGTDTITDFVIGEDVIGLADGLSFGQLTFTQEGQSTQISVGDDILAFLEQVNAEALMATETAFTMV